jgi:hypothetical protein
VIPTGRRTVFARARNGFHDARNVFYRHSGAGHHTGTMNLPRGDQIAGQETVHVMCPPALCGRIAGMCLIQGERPFFGHITLQRLEPGQ